MPQPGVQPPETQRQIRALEQRVAALERRLNNVGPESSPPLTFSYSGTLQNGSTSPPARFAQGVIIRVLACTLGTAGTTDTVLELLRSGLVAATVTIPAGQVIHNAPVGMILGADQETIALRCVTAGVGAADLSAQARPS